MKAHNESDWGNKSDHVKSFKIPPHPLTDFSNIVIKLTSGNGIFETDDNWNIQSVAVTLEGSGQPVTYLNKAGNPLTRLTGSSPSVTLHP